MKDCLPTQKTVSAAAAVKRDVHLECLWLKEWDRQKHCSDKKVCYKKQIPGIVLFMENRRRGGAVRENC